MKKLIVAGIIAIVGLFSLGRLTYLGSYVGTLWTQAVNEAKNVVPTKFELDRVRYEIAQMDRDIQNLISPIAERMAEVKILKKDIDETRKQLDEQKKNLLAVTTDLQNNPDKLIYGGKEYTLEQVRRKMSQDFQTYKLLEAKLTSQERALREKERALEASREQLSKLQQKKQEFELRLAQAEADQAALETAKVGTRLTIDNSRATDIETTLREIARRHEVERMKLALQANQTGSDDINFQNRGSREVSLQEVRDYLQRPQATSALPVAHK